MMLPALNLLAQKKPLIDSHEKIAEAAVKELDLAMTGPEGSFYLLGLEYGLKGEYTYEITIREKGEVASVLVKNNLGGTIAEQGIIKDYLHKKFTFSFKMPKGKRYKFDYTFKYNNQ
jgi:hypothetical protein